MYIIIIIIIIEMCDILTDVPSMSHCVSGYGTGDIRQFKPQGSVAIAIQYRLYNFGVLVLPSNGNVNRKRVKEKKSIYLYARKISCP